MVILLVFFKVYEQMLIAFPLQIKIVIKVVEILTYRKIASSTRSHLEAHVGFFRLLMKGIFGPLWISNNIEYTL